AFRVEQNNVVNAPEMLRALSDVAVRCLAFPNHLVDEPVGAEEVVEHTLDVVRDTPPDVHEDGPSITEKFPHERQSLIEHVKVRVGALAPHIAVRDHLKNGLVLDGE